MGKGKSYKLYTMNSDLMNRLNSWDVQSWDIDTIEVETILTIGAKDASLKSWLKIIPNTYREVKNSTKKEITWPDKLMIFFLFLWRKSLVEIKSFIPSSCFRKVKYNLMYIIILPTNNNWKIITVKIRSRLPNHNMIK